MPYRPYPNADRALRHLRQQQAVYLYAHVPQRVALGPDLESSGGWSEAAVRPSLEHVARYAGMNATAWSASIEQALTVMAAAGVRTDGIYDPAADQFFRWTDPGA